MYVLIAVFITYVNPNAPNMPSMGVAMQEFSSRANYEAATDLLKLQKVHTFCVAK